MPMILQCRCGKTKEVSRYAIEVQGQKYCSRECSRKYRVYATKPETLSAKVTVTMTEAQRDALERQAEMADTSITELGRQYIIEGMERVN